MINYHARSMWVIGLLWALSPMLLLPWLTDRDPPFEVLSTSITSPAHRGEAITITRKVRREVDRACRIEFTRYFFDSAGTLTVIDTGAIGAEGRVLLHKDTLKVVVRVPEYFAPGVSKFVTDSRYVCNPIHELWPIRQTTIAEFEVIE